MRRVSRANVLSQVGRIYRTAPWKNVTVRAAIGTSGANAAILCINILTGVITARTLAPVGRGELAAMIMWPQFLGFALALGIPTSLVFHMQRNDYPRSELLTGALCIALFAGFVGSCVGVLAVPYALAPYDADAVRAAQWFMVVTPFGVALHVLNASFLREGSFALYNSFRLAPSCVTLALLAALLAIGRLTPVTAAAAYLVPTLPMILVTLTVTCRKIGLARRFNRDATWSLLRYGLACYGAEVAGAISLQLDRILVVWLLSPAAMGLYVVALSFSRLFQQIAISISTVLLPKVSSVSARDVIRLTAKAALISFIISLVPAIPATLFAPQILGLFFGSQFAAASGVFVILTAEAIVGSMALIVSQAFLGLGQPAKMSLYSVIGLLTLIPLLLVLGVRYGLVGAASAILGSSIIRVAIMLFGLRKLYREALGKLEAS